MNILPNSPTIAEWVAYTNGVGVGDVVFTTNTSGWHTTTSGMVGTFTQGRVFVNGRFWIDVDSSGQLTDDIKTCLHALVNDAGDAVKDKDFEEMMDI